MIAYPSSSQNSEGTAIVLGIRFVDFAAKDYELRAGYRQPPLNQPGFIRCFSACQ
jgi:hypothetical protein